MYSNNQTIDYIKVKNMSVLSWALIENSQLKIGNDNVAILMMINYDSRTNDQAIQLAKELLDKTLPRPIAFLINNHSYQKLEKETLIRMLNLSQYKSPYEFFEINAVNGEGVPAVFQWLDKQLFTDEDPSKLEQQ